MEDKIMENKPKKKASNSALRPQLLMAITDRGKSGRVRDMFARSGVFLSSLSMGNGTASSEIMDILGLVNSEKDVLLSIVSIGGAREIMALLNDRLGGTVGSKGIVMQFGVNGASSVVVKAVESEHHIGQGVKKVNEKTKYSLIIISVKQGYADSVMAVAKEAGARDGTVLRALQSDNENTEILLGKTFKQEREILTILTSGDKRNDIMEAVNAKCGVSSDANGILLSLPVEDVAKLS